MNLLELTVKEFIDEIDSNNPAPGGGSASALSVLMGVSLVRMYGHLSINKKKFLKLDEAVQTQFINGFDELLNIKHQVEPLIQKDTESFNLIMDAFKLPKTTDEEKEIRKKAILEGTTKAIEVPLQVADLSLSALKECKKMSDYGNMNSFSDFGVGVNMIFMGLLGAIYNVKINVPGLDDPYEIEQLKQECISIEIEAVELKDYLINLVENRI